MSFEGFPEQALDFYDGLLADNSKAYWTDHRETYESAVRGPLLALLADLEPEFGAGKVFRPYRDVRFSKDKTPYKTHAAAVVVDEGDAALYVQLSADGLRVGGGYWHTTTAQARRLRAAVADGRTGAQLERVLAGLDGLQVSGEQLVRLPKEFAPDAPRVELLRHKTLTAGHEWPPAEWLHTAECRDRVAAAWRALQPLNAWLGRCVGPASRD